MLASLAQQLRERRAGAGGGSEGDDGVGDEGGGGGQPVYLDDNCEVRPPFPPPFTLSIYKLILALPRTSPVIDTYDDRLCEKQQQAEDGHNDPMNRVRKGTWMTE